MKLLLMRCCFKGGISFFLLLIFLSLFAVFSGYMVKLPSGMQLLFSIIAEISLAFVMASVGIAFLLGIAACSSFLQRVISYLAAFMVPVPVSAFVVLLTVVLPSSPWGAAFIGAFGLVWRSVDEILLSERNIPAAYIKTAQALRLGSWRIFWHVHMAVLYPALWRGFIKDIPDFWLRLLIAQSCMGIFEGFFPELDTLTFSTGLWLLLEILGVAFVLMLGLYYSVIQPLRHYMYRYESVILPAQKEIIVPFWVRHVMMGLLFLLVISQIGFAGMAQCLSVLLTGWGIFLLILCLSGMLWMGIGVVFLKRRNTTTPSRCERWFAVLAIISTLLLVLPVYLLFGIDNLLIVLLFLSIQTVFGRSYFSVTYGSVYRRFMKTASRLRLSTFIQLQEILIPLLGPSLIKAAISVSPLLWNMIFLFSMYLPLIAGKEETGFGGDYFILFSQQNEAQALGFSSVMIMVSIATLYYGLYPLENRLSRKYGFSL